MGYFTHAQDDISSNFLIIFSIVICSLLIVICICGGIIMRLFIFRNFDKIIKIIGALFLIMGAITLIYSLRLRIILFIVALINLGIGYLLIKIK